MVVSGRGGMTESVLTPPELTLDGDTWTLFTALDEAAEVIFGNEVSLCAVISDRECRWGCALGSRWEIKCARDGDVLL